MSAHLPRIALVVVVLSTTIAVPAAGSGPSPASTQPDAPAAGLGSAAVAPPSVVGSPRVAAFPRVAASPRVASSRSPSAPAAIPAPICGVPRSAGVLALVPPPAPDGTESDTGPSDPAVGANRTAVVDRIEGDTAVLLVEARGEVVARRLVRRSALPRAARHDDAVLTVSVVDDSVAAITYRPVETARRRRAVERRFDSLAEPAPDGGGGGDRPAVC